MSRAEDLSGTWIGMYSYPDGTPPVRFDAVLLEREGLLSGSIEEVDEHWGGEHLVATVDGSREGTAVRFTKFYESGDEGFDTVFYSGSVDAEGVEISGRWSIPGAWDGDFIMTRETGAEVAAEQEVGETIR